MRFSPSMLKGFSDELQLIFKEAMGPGALRIGKMISESLGQAGKGGSMAMKSLGAGTAPGRAATAIGAKSGLKPSMYSHIKDAPKGGGFSPGQVLTGSMRG